MNRGWATNEPLLGGVHAPCSLYNFPSCSLLLSIFCPLLLFRFFPAPFSFFLCSLLLFNFSSCSMLLFQTFHCSLLLFTIFGAACSRITLVCSLLLYLFYGLLLAPLCQIRLAPCSGITPNGGSLVMPTKQGYHLIIHDHSRFMKMKRRLILQNIPQPADKSWYLTTLADLDFIKAIVRLRKLSFLNIHK